MSYRDQVHFFPVRHHSPSCALAVRDYAMALKPDAILIEGPSEFNDQLPELFLSHQLPIAIYTYVNNEEYRGGAYHPFCEYSPEWQALISAKTLGCEVQFIDLPWPSICALRLENETELDQINQEHRYADSELRRSGYISKLCQNLNVEDFDSLWDELFEIETLSPSVLKDRVATFCLASRTFEEEDRSRQGITKDSVNAAREAYMAWQIQQTCKRLSGNILVVTGGFHTSGLITLMENGEVSAPNLSTDWLDQGAALTPYSYERLDALTGYQAGVPGPEFYHHVWQSRSKGEPYQEGPIINDIAHRLRSYNLTFSTADRIAAEASMTCLANLRGHETPWREDLFDGLSSTTIKDEIAHGGYHPMHDVIQDVFRGHRQGKLHEKTLLPPLSREIDQLLKSQGLWPERVPRELHLDLLNPEERCKNQILRRLQLLEIEGFELISAPDFVARTDLVEVTTLWKIHWTPGFDATKIEAAKYGASFEEAANQRLLELIQEKGDLGNTAELLIHAALCGLGHHAINLFYELEQQTALCNDFIDVVTVLNHLTYLHQFDDILLLAHIENTLPLTQAVYERALYLLDALGCPESGMPYVEAIKTVLNCYIYLSPTLGWQKEPIVMILQNQCNNIDQSPDIRGASLGGVFLLGCTEGDAILSFIDQVTTEQLGDFLTGLFNIARETIQHHPELLKVIDEVVELLDPHTFMLALPSLRLAFTYFTPREKQYLASHLPSIEHTNKVEIDDTFSPSLQDIEMAMKFETSLIGIAKDYGINLESRDEP